MVVVVDNACGVTAMLTLFAWRAVGQRRYDFPLSQPICCVRSTACMVKLRMYPAFYRSLMHIWLARSGPNIDLKTQIPADPALAFGPISNVRGSDEYQPAR